MSELGTGRGRPSAVASPKICSAALTACSARHSRVSMEKSSRSTVVFIKSKRLGPVEVKLTA